MEEDEIEELEEIEEMGVGRWQIQEVKEALRKTKPGKAVGVDEVGSDLLRADMEYTTSIGFGKLKGGRRCGRRDLMSRYSREVICVITTFGEE